MRAYVQALHLKRTLGVIHHTIISTNLFSPFGSHQTKVGKGNQNGDKTTDSNKMNGSKGQYNGSKKLNPKKLELYWKENRCFRCETIGNFY